MEIITKTIFWFCLAIILYVYFGYPVLLTVLLPFLRKKVSKADITPKVTQIISSYNEEEVIASKIENSLAMDYPEDKLEIMVVSDCSSDDTDEIVNRYAGKGVKLVRQTERKGKTAGLNLAVPQASGEIIVFSDANAFYEPDSIKKLVRNFHDTSVGCVTGEARYQKKWRSSSEKSEKLYWKNEIFLKKMESKMGSMVGGDGAIYAIRKELFEQLQPTDINDFVNPLQIVTKGYRGLYEPEAICYEETANNLLKEFKRKKRIVNRSWNGLFRVKPVLNPMRAGFFTLEIVSHKLLRWLIPFLLLGLLFSNWHIANLHSMYFYTLTLLLQIAFYILALAGYLQQGRTGFMFYLPYYFCLVNAASLIGILNYFRGNIATTWSPERAAKDEDSIAPQLDKTGIIKLLIVSCTVVFVIILFLRYNTFSYFPALLFWISWCLIAYTYFGYPLLLLLLTTINKKTVKKSDYFPTVSLIIPAYNEETDIEEKLQNSLSLNYPADKLQIVVASDGSTDGTNDIITRYLDKGIQFRKFEQRRGKIAVINDIMKEIKSDVVVFSDANAMYRSDAIAKLARNFHDPSVGVVSGDARFIQDKIGIKKTVKYYYQYERFLQTKESELHSMVGADGAIFAIRRELFEPLPEDTILDDFVMPMQIATKGWRVVYEKEAKAYEAAPTSLREEFSRKIRLLGGAVQAFKSGVGQPVSHESALMFSYLSHKAIRWLVPVFGIIAYLSNLFLLGSTFFTVSFWIQTGILFLALLGFKLRSNLFSIPFYLVFNNTAMLIGLLKGVFNKQSVKWQRFERQKLLLSDCLESEILRKQGTQ